MKREEFLSVAEETFIKCQAILEKKNKDYAGQGEDALRNFKQCSVLGVTDPVRGVLVRMSDKFARVTNILTSGVAHVKEESAEDTIEDLINYCVILKALIREGRPVVIAGPVQVTTGSTTPFCPSEDYRQNL